MGAAEKNRKIVGNVGDLVENLYNEVAPLPFSEVTKRAMVMVMVSNCLKSNGDILTFCQPNFQAGF